MGQHHPLVEVTGWEEEATAVVRTVEEKAAAAMEAAVKVAEAVEAADWVAAGWAAAGWAAAGWAAAAMGAYEKVVVGSCSNTRHPYNRAAHGAAGTRKGCMIHPNDSNKDYLLVVTLHRAPSPPKPHCPNPLRVTPL